jgi:hypothetical protein
MGQVGVSLLAKDDLGASASGKFAYRSRNQHANEFR